MAHRAAGLKYADKATVGGLIDGSASNMGATLTTAPVSVSDCQLASFQFVWSAGSTPVGTASVQGSLDGVNFDDLGIQKSDGTVVASLPVTGNTGHNLINLSQLGMAYIRAVYTFTSGSGQLAILYRVKAI